MYTWSHYAFRQRLLDYAQKFSFKRVFRVSEYYTSKTCGGCGALNELLGSSKTFACPMADCDVCGDRDILASRNIFLRYIPELFM
jgi:transposase